MTINLRDEYGRRVTGRLEREEVAWLTTVGRDLTPQPRPVWFLWDVASQTFLIYSQPHTAKVRHIRRQPRVALNLITDPQGNDVVVFTGTAQIDPEAPPADHAPAYVNKYRRGLKELNMTPAEFAADYSLAIWLRPEHLRGF